MQRDLPTGTPLFIPSAVGLKEAEKDEEAESKMVFLFHVPDQPL